MIGDNLFLFEDHMLEFGNHIASVLDVSVRSESIRLSSGMQNDERGYAREVYQGGPC